MLVYCVLPGCQNTAHCLIDGQPICAFCLDSMAAMNSDNEAWLRAAKAVAVPFEGPEWTCEVCFQLKNSMQVVNGVCADCRDTMPLLEPIPSHRWRHAGDVGGCSDAVFPGEW